MSELSDLVGVLGAVDDHVVEQPELIPVVAALLGPYEHGAAGWFRAFREWLNELPTPDDEPHLDIPNLDDALANLSDTDVFDIEKRDPGLRLVTLAVLARVMPDYGPGGDFARRTEGALAVPGVIGDSDRVNELLGLLADTERFPDATSWVAMMNVAVEQGLITPDANRPLRCAGAVVDVSVAGHPTPATAITTSFVDDTLDFAHATVFLDPAQWPHCCPAWCEMRTAADAPDGTQRYQEIIGLACPRPLLTTCLGFRKVTRPTVSVVAYRRADPTPDCGSDGEVLVDEGSIEVRDRAPHPGVAVMTTKRVLFKHLRSGPLSMVACVFGYADLGQLLVYNCARRHEPQVAPTLADKGPPAPGDGDDCATVVDDLASLAKGCVTDGAAGFRASYDRAVAGTYTTNDAASDFATVLKRACHDVVKAVGAGVKALGIAAAPPADTTAPPGDAAAPQEPV